MPELLGRKGAMGIRASAFLLCGTDQLFRGTTAYSFLAGVNFHQVMSGFAQVTAEALTGTNALADQYDTTGNATFTGQGNKGTLTMPGATVAVSEFGMVRATNLAAGFDTLQLAALNYVFQSFGNFR